MKPSKLKTGMQYWQKNGKKATKFKSVYRWKPDV
jgi:hypothetical protein